MRSNGCRIRRGPIFSSLTVLALGLTGAMIAPASAQDTTGPIAGTETAITAGTATRPATGRVNDATASTEAASDIPADPGNTSTTSPLEDVFPSILPDKMDDLTWEKRVLIVFADSPNDPNFRRQIKALREFPTPLRDRDVVVFTDTDRRGTSMLREMFRPRGFMIVLLGKDGQIKLRKPSPWDVRELSRTIDKFPLRQQEIRDRALAVVPEN